MIKGLFSVLVPAYNVENYLAKCLNSIIAQTYDNFECIIINDGSTDNTEKICQEYTQKDKRIKYFNQENQGLSVVRNKGIELSQGEFIIFVDSDDWINKDYLQVAYDMFQSNQDVDTIVFNYDICKKYSFVPIRYNQEIDIVGSCQVLKRLVMHRIGVDIWAKAFRREVFDGIEFPVGKYAQSFVVLAQCIHKSKKICLHTSVVYNYAYSTLNSTCKIHREAVLKDARELRKQRNQFIADNYPQLRQMIKIWC